MQPFLRAIGFAVAVFAFAAIAEPGTVLNTRPATLAFNAPEAVVTATETLIVEATQQDGSIDAKIRYQSGEPGWLRLTETAPHSYRINVLATNLPAGRYIATITLTTSKSAKSVVVPVTLTIGLGIVN